MKAVAAAEGGGGEVVERQPKEMGAVTAAPPLFSILVARILVRRSFVR